MKKIIHALTIIDKSGSMMSFRSRTIEGINSNIATLKKEVDENTEILNTTLQFSSIGNNWHSLSNDKELNFVFTRIGCPVGSVEDITEKDYSPAGGTPLLDAIGLGIEKIKEFHGDKLRDDNISVIVTIITDGEENSSTLYNRSEIKKMIEHFEADGKWTFTFIGCGSFENVSNTSAQLGINCSNTIAYDASEEGTCQAFACASTSYLNYSRSVKSGVVDKALFTQK